MVVQSDIFIHIIWNSENTTMNEKIMNQKIQYHSYFNIRENDLYGVPVYCAD